MDGRRTIIGGARVVSGAEKKSFDRGGPVWPPRSNVTNDRLRGGGSGGALPARYTPPQQREAVQVVAKFFKPAKASNSKQKRAKAGKSRQKQA